MGDFCKPGFESGDILETAMTDNPLSQPQPLSPPSASPPKRKGPSSAVTIAIVFVFTLIMMTSLGVVQSIINDGRINLKSAYLPLGCVLTAGLGLLFLTRLTKGPIERVRSAVYWAGFSMVGFAVAELVTFGAVTAETGSRVAFWSMFGAIIGMLSTPRKPIELK
jgi:hypothetical protein